MRKLLALSFVLTVLLAAVGFAHKHEQTQQNVLSETEQSVIALNVIECLAAELAGAQSDVVNYSDDVFVSIDIGTTETAQRLFGCIRNCEQVRVLTGAALKPMALPIRMNGKELGTFDCIYIDDPVSGRFVGIEFSDGDAAAFYEYVMSLKGTPPLLPDGNVSDVYTPELNMQTLKDLTAHYGEELSWSAFSAYYCEEIATEPYTLRYPVGMDYYLQLSGDPAGKPDSILLISAYDSGQLMDLTAERLDDFLLGTKQTGVFSYEEVLALTDLNAPGVKPDGFQNITRVALTGIDEVIAQARNECTVDYTISDVFYDAEAMMWEVLFWSGTPGGSESVYMDAYGITKLIVYGE